MKNISLLIKPASSICNMRCRYCFYEDVSDRRKIKSTGIMTENTAEKIISRAYDAAERGGVISFMFQGGEPTAAGLKFFEKFIELEKKHAKAGVRAEHSIQTNGYSLNRDWAEFFKRNGFLVGLSLDGTEQLHDKFRVDSTGSGTWNKAVNTLKLLDEFEVETNILCVVTGQAAKKGRQIYRSLTGLGEHPLQFTACMDPLEDERGGTEYSLTAPAYGKFLCDCFDCWYADFKRGKFVSIRAFDDYIRRLLRLPVISCSATGGCGHYLVIESDGSLYPCDFYALDEWRLGSIFELSYEEALKSSTSAKFVSEGAKRPTKCAECKFFALCRGGCMRDFTGDGENYFCEAYRAFFGYAAVRLEECARICAENMLRNT